jgi:glycosyltransferase involved in cell wall biosynthesis
VMVSFIIPARDEARAIRGVIDSIQQAASTFSFECYEIVVIDDGSLDETATIAEQASARVLRNLYALGYGRSIKRGIQASKFDTIIIVDGDGSYPIESVGALLADYRRGFDLVVGARSNLSSFDHSIKGLFRALLRLFVEFTVGRKVADVNSGFRIFSKSTIRHYIPKLSDSFSFTTSMTLAYFLTGKTVQYVPISYRPRIGTSKVRIIRDSLRTAQFVVQAILFYNPIKLFLLVALTSFVSIVVVCSLAGYLSDVSSTVLAVALLSVFMIFAIGLVADFLRQSLSHTNDDDARSN